MNLKELIEEKSNLSKKEINELLNILEEIPNPKKELKNKDIKKS